MQLVQKTKQLLHTKINESTKSLMCITIFMLFQLKELNIRSKQGSNKIQRRQTKHKDHMGKLKRGEGKFLEGKKIYLLL